MYGVYWDFFLPINKVLSKSPYVRYICYRETRKGLDIIY